MTQLLIFLLTIATFPMIISCAPTEIELKPGPQLGEVLADHSKSVSVRAEKASILSTIERCGFEQTATADQKAALATGNAFDIRNEMINRPEGPVSAISITGQIFSLQNFRSTTELKPISLGTSALKGKALSLLPTAVKILEASKKDAASAPKTEEVLLPIIIRANCFELEAGEILDTGGRDLYILADKVKIHGTIRTTPPAKDDQPGAPGGSLHIAAVIADFGEQSQIDLRGGNAGEMKLSPGRVISSKNPAEKAALVAELKDKLANQVRQETKVRDHELPMATDDDTKLIFETWEGVRSKLLVADAVSVEAAIYNIENLDPKPQERDALEKNLERIREVLANDSTTAADRKQIIDDPIYYNLIIASWRGAFSLAQKNKMKNATNDQSKIFWIINGRLNIQIDEIHSRQQLKPEYKENPTYTIEAVEFRELPGGSGGSLDISIPILTKSPSSVRTDSGCLSHNTSQNPILDWQPAPGESIAFPLLTYSHQVVSIQVRKPNDDKLVAEASSTTVEKEKPELTIWVSPKLISSDSRAKLVNHPNFKSVIKSKSAIVTYRLKPTDILEGFSTWGVAEEKNRVREFIQIDSSRQESAK